MIRAILCLLLAVSLVSAGAKPGGRCNQNDYERFLCSSDWAQDTTNVPQLPSGAPPTNNGFAYSQVSYTDNFLYVAALFLAATTTPPE